MKALYLRTVPWFNLKSGGSVGHTSGVINALSKKIDIDVISNDTLAEVSHPFRIIKPLLSFLPFFGEFLYNIRLLFTLKNVKQYDFIYQRHSAESFLGAYLGKKHDIPFVLEFNSSETWKLKNWAKKRNFPLNILIRFYRLFIKYPIAYVVQRYNLKNASTIVVVSNVLKQNLIKEGVDATKILVNPNGVDIDKYHPDIFSKSLVEKLNVNDKNIIGFIGTFGQWHGGLVLAEAINVFFEKYPARIHNTIFLLIGDGNQLPEVKKIIKNDFKSKNVIFTGRIPQQDGVAHLSICHVFLSPHVPNPDGTEFFGSPTKLFEYMAMGKPIVASELNQIGEILTDGEDAILITPNSPALLSDAIENLLKDGTLQNKIGKQARSIAIEKYSWDKHVDKILNFINEN